MNRSVVLKQESRGSLGINIDFCQNLPERVIVAKIHIQLLTVN